MGERERNVRRLLGGVALGGQLDDFPLALGQHLAEVEFVAGADPAEVALEERLRGGGIEEHLALGDGVDRFEQIGVGARFADVPGTTCFEDGQEIALLGVDGQDKYTRW